MAARKCAVAAIVALFVLAGAGSALAAHVHLVVTPATVSPDGVVHVSASASPCPSRDTVILISAAFPGHAYGVGAVYGRVGSHGAFSVRARIRLGLRPGRYHVGARCGGGNLGVSAYFRVR
jgi:hypothetical protein